MISSYTEVEVLPRRLRVKGQELMSSDHDLPAGSDAVPEAIGPGAASSEGVSLTPSWPAPQLPDTVPPEPASSSDWEFGSQDDLGDDEWEEPTPEPASSRPSTTRTMVAVGLVAALIGGATGAIAATALSNDKKGVSVLTLHEGSSPAATLPNGATIPQLVRSVLPSIVSIDSSGGGSEDQGTGMIISSDGLVLTNNHVIANAAAGGTITVTQSGTTSPQNAALIGRDPSNDVALIRIIDAHDLQAVAFARSRFVQVGTAVVAIGNALGLAAGTPTVTSGIVSALGRSVSASDGSGSSSESLTNMIQTDAAINPGNSGGPLLNARGEVIGMNTAVAGSTSDGTNAQNIGFAIPSDHLTELLPKLEKGGTATSSKAFLGVYLLTMTPQLQQQYGFTMSQGAVIAQVNPSSPAADAGLQQGDVVVRANGTTIATADDLSSVITKLHPGDKLHLVYYEGNKRHTTTAILGTKA